MGRGERSRSVSQSAGQPSNQPTNHCYYHSHITSHQHSIAHISHRPLSSVVSVRKECLQLGGVSLDCQNSYQVRGVDRETSMAQCASSIEAYKECVSRKADVDSRRKWMEMRRKEGTNKQRSSANT